MKKNITIIIIIISLFSKTWAQEDFTKYVDPTIGNVSRFLEPNYPTMHQPNQMLRMFSIKKDYILGQVEDFPLQVNSHMHPGVFQMKVSAGEISQDYWKNTKEFYIFYTHFFNGNEPLGRLNASKLDMERINKLDRFGSWEKELPLFLMGDFNYLPESAPHKIFVGDGSKQDPNIFMDTNTVNSTEIDWILYKGNVNTLGYEEVEYSINGISPSDHKRILVKLSVNET